MNRKQTVCTESTTRRPGTTGAPAVVVNAPTLLDGVGELWRICRAFTRSDGGVRAIRRSRNDWTLVAVFPDGEVAPGRVVTEYVR